MRKLLVFCLIIFLTFEFAYSKDTFKDDQGNAGHADDISKLLTGRPYYSNSGNHRLFPILTGLAHIMYLTVDSTHGADDPSQGADDVQKAIRYLNENKSSLKIDRIPNLNEFLTPGGSFHGEYTHLGWNHKYSEETQRKFDVRKEILRSALEKQFNFFPLIRQNRQKLDSLAALLYYVHILGDHENNKQRTARSRIPIKILNEQDLFIDGRIVPVRWERNESGTPNTTIIAELNIHLKILFGKQKDPTRFDNMIKQINGYLPEGQNEKARWLLRILFDNVPLLLREEPFARNFVKML